MIFWDKLSSLLATGLSLRTISSIIDGSRSEEELEEKLLQHGEKYFFRYRTIADYYSLVKSGQQKLPIIIIISGIPGVGKTTIAKELSAALNIGIVLGGDALRSSLRTILPREGNEAFFTSVYNTWKIFGEKRKATIIKGYQAQSLIMNKAVQRVITDRGLRDGESMIVEYLHFHPSQFDKNILTHPSIIPLLLVITDLTKYNERIIKREYFSHLRSAGDRLLAQQEQYLIIQEYIEKDARRFNLPVINVDNLEAAFDDILSIIIQRISELNTRKNINTKINLLEAIKKERGD
ncbi:MAG: AAA family ATPase [Candidatus Heimdallarchaeota archaeon]